MIGADRVREKLRSPSLKVFVTLFVSPMIFCWNVRGLNGHDKQRAVSRWITASNYLLGGILESRIRDRNITSAMSNFLPGWSFDSNHSMDAPNGRIIVVWNPAISLVTYLKTDQLMLCGVFIPATNQEFTVAFVYARNTEEERRPLWQTMAHLVQGPLLNNSPWLVVGDFNQPLATSEVYSYHPYDISHHGMLEFQECLTDCGLFDLAFSGCLLTWSNRQPENPICRKLDRALCNEAWLDAFPLSSATFEPPDPSDHSPCSIRLTEERERRRTSFRFFKFLTTHKDYRDRLEEAWQDSTFPGSPMVVLYRRLRDAKYFCQSLNRSSFSGIQKRAKASSEKLKALQIQVFTDPSPRLFEEEKEARLDSNFWNAAEESFLKQKSRLKWLKEGDSNTRFFHKTVKSNLSRNIIHHLRLEDNTKVTEVAQLKSMVEQFYFNLLGSPNTAVDPYSVDTIRSLHPFRCGAPLATKLSRLPSSQEIKEAVFSLPDNKAPGPDGFSAEFFTSAWDVVGNDLVYAVQDFFGSSSLLRQANTTSICLIPKFIGAEKIADFRPVSCCSTVYKVISRLLSVKIKLFLSDVVQGNQVGFIEGRLLCENVLLASELVSDFHKEGPTTRGCLQVDLTKAYDSVDWRFILNILSPFDLPLRL